MAGHVFKCALCGERVSSDVRPARCPKCGGKAFVHEEDEPTIEAAARELEEETGYASEHLEPLISIVTAIAFCDEVIDIYLATGLKKTQQHLDEDEYIDVYAYTPQELADMIYSGKIQDSKTVAAIMAYINRK